MNWPKNGVFCFGVTISPITECTRYNIKSNKPMKKFLFLGTSKKRHCIYKKNLIVGNIIAKNGKLCKYCSLCIRKIIVHKLIQLMVTM